MTVEDRRQHTRLVKPLEGVLKGLSGATSCRISDISWGGCFIQTVSVPPINADTAVTLPIHGNDLEIAGRVQYVESPMGFAMTFDKLTAEQVAELSKLLGQPPASLTQ